MGQRDGAMISAHLAVGAVVPVVAGSIGRQARLTTVQPEARE